jgi:hypothetical protein
LRSLIHYAWNLAPERIKISEKVYDAIEQNAAEMSIKYGMCTDLPLVHPGDFKKTLCRLSVAMAIFDLNSKDDFETIDVELRHVRYIRHDFLEKIYDAKNCLLQEYSAQYAQTSVLTMIESTSLLNTLLAMLDSKSPYAKSRILSIFKEICEIGAENGQKIQQAELSNHTSCDRRTIRRDMSWFIKEHLIQSSRGYFPTLKGVTFYNYLTSRDKTISDPALQLFSEQTLEQTIIEN